MTRDRGPLQGLIGRSLLGVRYYGVGTRSEVSEWFHIDDGRHLADFGLDLIVEGTTCSITWRQTAARQFALAVEMSHHLSDSLLAGWFEDVSAHPDWRPFVGRRIERARWINLPGTEGGQEDHDPCAMELTSESGRSVQIMAANLVHGEHESLMSGDDVMIVFGQGPEVGPSSPA